MADTVESIILYQPSTSSKIPETTIRRKNMVYPDAVANKKCCIICNKDKEQKGGIVPLALITLREIDTKKHKAEETLLLFAIMWSTIGSSKKLLKEYYLSLQRNLYSLLMYATTEKNVIWLSGVRGIVMFSMYTIYKVRKVLPKVELLCCSIRKEWKSTKRSTKVIPPDERSLKMKILRSNYIAHSWKSCLDSNYVFLDATKSGWHRVNNLLVPLWYEGWNLPTDEEYNEHINSKNVASKEENTDTNSNSSDSDSDNEYPLSDTNTSSSEDELSKLM